MEGLTLVSPHAISAILGLQGHIPGVSFAHSLASHTHARDVDAYLDIIDEMPESLKSAKVRLESRAPLSILQSVAAQPGLKNVCTRKAIQPKYFMSTAGHR